MHRLLVSCLLAAALTASACSNNDVTAPTTPAPTAAISPSDSVYQLGQTQTFTLTASTTPTNVVWSSSNPNVLTIDAGGNATAVGIGAATITATADSGLSAILSVQVTPVYSGNWIGTARVLACTEISGFQANGFCAANLGTTNSVTLILAQAGSSLSGTMTKSQGANVLNGTVTGAIGAGGDCTFTGTLGGLADGVNLQLSIVSWNSLADGATMTGNWTVNITSPQITGIATLQYSLNLQLVP